jgi:hypothetical protein
MEKYHETNKSAKKKYNSDKTFIQIPKDLHLKIKDFCKIKGIKVKDFIESSILRSLE